MKFLKKSGRANPKMSLVLLDWSVRESFHLLHYLEKQTVPRDSFEVIVIEYYSRVSEAVRKFEEQVDTWVLLEVPESCYYHKHLMYNVGIVLSRAEIVVVGDSDAMVKPTFIGRIIDRFQKSPNIVYHIDQFRNARRDLYPFNFPSFEDVQGDGCINMMNGKTVGVLDEADPVHSRNYGACMCARRDDLIAIGGADEHIDFIGHICGPYDMTFRLSNLGRREIWETDEFTYHTWHPGASGDGNYLGPHDGRHMSTTSLEALVSGRTDPLVENRAIFMLRTGQAAAADAVLDKLIDETQFASWGSTSLDRSGANRSHAARPVPIETYKGYRLFLNTGEIHAYRILERAGALGALVGKPAFRSLSLDEIRNKIDSATPPAFRLTFWYAWIYAFIGRFLHSVRRRSALLPGPIPLALKIFISCLLAGPLGLIAVLFLPRRVIGALQSIAADTWQQARALRDLAITLDQVSAESTSGGEKVIVLVDERSSGFVMSQATQRPLLLRVLNFIGQLPAIEIRSIQTERDLDRCLRQLEAARPSGRVVIPNELFVRFHAVALQHKLTNQLLIV